MSTLPRLALCSLGALLAAGTLAGCVPTNSTATAPAEATANSELPIEDSAAPMPAPDTCTVRHEAGQELPDPRCTPGAINPDVTQATIDSTICKSGWTATVRPSTSLTNRMKKQSDLAYNLSTGTQGEYDHLISLELGGAPDDPRNLWIEPGKIPHPKDAVENKLSEAVCSRLIPLATAQQAIAADWVTAITTAGLTVSGGKLCLAADTSRCATSKHGSSG